MDKETLSNYGWIVICVLVLAVMIALAGPFGNFIANAVKSTTQGLFDVNQSALNATGLINIGDQKFDVPDVNNGVDEDGNYDHNAPELHPNGTIPEGGIYTKSSGEILNAGQAFPDETNLGDKYVYGNYEYRYKQIYYLTSHWLSPTYATGWGVRCINNIAQPGSIMESINGEPITDCYKAFENLSNLVVAPAIPSAVTGLEETFIGCSSLKDISKVVIPTGVTELPKTFNRCTSLENAEDLIIHENIKSLKETFRFCESLTKAPDFTNATSLESMYGTFWVCKSLQIPPDISNCVSLTDMYSTFDDCEHLNVAPKIPANVTSMSYTFNQCISLEDTIEIPCTLINQNYTYQDCSATIAYYCIIDNSTVTNNENHIH